MGLVEGEEPLDRTKGGLLVTVRDHRDLCVRDRAWCPCVYCAEERNPNWMPCDGDEGDDDE